MGGQVADGSQGAQIVCRLAEGEVSEEEVGALILEEAEQGGGIWIDLGREVRLEFGEGDVENQKSDLLLQLDSAQ